MFLVQGKFKFSGSGGTTVCVLSSKEISVLLGVPWLLSFSFFPICKVFINSLPVFLLFLRCVKKLGGMLVFKKKAIMLLCYLFFSLEHWKRRSDVSVCG